MQAASHNTSKGKGLLESDAVDPDWLRMLRRPRYVSNTLHIVGEWSSILLAIFLARQSGLAIQLLCGLWIGSRQHALAALAHEAVHARLLPKPWNDRVAETVLAWPIFFSVRAYRRVHLAHHRHLSTDRDPDWVRNQQGRWGQASLQERLRLLIGLGRPQFELREMFAETSASSGAPTWLRVSYYSALVLALVASGQVGTAISFWLLPWAFVFLPLMRLRGIAEHWGTYGRPDEQVRSLTLPFWVRFLWLPKGMDRHAEHHAFPAVPFQALPALGGELDRVGQSSWRTKGLGGLLRELCQRGPEAG